AGCRELRGCAATPEALVQRGEQRRAIRLVRKVTMRPDVVKRMCGWIERRRREHQIERPAARGGLHPLALVGLGPRQDVTPGDHVRSEEHTSDLQSRENLVCRLLLE